MKKLNSDVSNNEAGGSAERAIVSLCEGMAGPTGSFVAANTAGTAVTSIIGPTGNTANTTTTSNTEHAGETKPAWSSYICNSPRFEDKKLVLEHILYEFHMYLWTTKNLLGSGFSKGNFKYEIKNTIIHDIIYIAQKISLRNILYFFYPKTCKSSDICFTKFFKKTVTGETHLFAGTRFGTYFTDVCGIPYWNTDKCITNMLHKIIAHLTDTRINWSDIEENYEYILGKQEIQGGVYTNVKDAVKDFLNAIQENQGKDIIYKYIATDDSRQPKDIAEELKTTRIQNFIKSINNLL